VRVGGRRRHRRRRGSRLAPRVHAVETHRRLIQLSHTATPLKSTIPMHYNTYVCKNIKYMYTHTHGRHLLLHLENLFGGVEIKY